MDTDYSVYSDWEIKKFAGKVKEIVSILTGIPVKDFEKAEIKEKVLGREWDLPFGIGIKNMSVREMLQKVGTDCMRRHLHPDVWINALFADYRLGVSVEEFGSQIVETQDYPYWIITDVRFPNEADRIKEHGGILIRIDRRDIPRMDHESETAMDDYHDWDYLIQNDGTIEELFESVEEVYNDYTNNR